MLKALRAVRASVPGARQGRGTTDSVETPGACAPGQAYGQAQGAGRSLPSPALGTRTQRARPGAPLREGRARA